MPWLPCCQVWSDDHFAFQGICVKCTPITRPKAVKKEEVVEYEVVTKEVQINGKKAWRVVKVPKVKS